MLILLFSFLFIFPYANNTRIHYFDSSRLTSDASLNLLKNKRKINNKKKLNISILAYYLAEQIASLFYLLASPFQSVF